MLFHVSYHISLQPELSNLKKVLSKFPGVPIFFTVSGFLITASILKNPNIKYYARNRFLRIYPGLYACFGITFLILLFTGVLSKPAIGSGDIIIWSGFSLFSIYPNFTPAAIKNQLLTTDPNGSLWTIPIELQFYMIIPALYFLFRNGGAVRSNIIILTLMVGSVLLNYYRNSLSEEYFSPIFWKFIAVSVFPHFWNFGIGMLIYLNWNRIQNLFNSDFRIAKSH